MENKKYNIWVNNDALHAMTPNQIKEIHHFIGDFLNFENNTPTTSIHPIPALSETPISVVKDICFDGNGREPVTEYSINVGDDSITNLTSSQIIDLYNVLQSFFMQAEKPRIKSDISRPGISISITDKPVENPSFIPCENTPFIVKRTRLAGKSKQPINEYRLYTPHGIIWNLTRENFISIYEITGRFLNFKI